MEKDSHICVDSLSCYCKERRTRPVTGLRQSLGPKLREALANQRPEPRKRRRILVAVMLVLALVGCVDDDIDVSPDAAVVTDAPVDCAPPGLPTCFSLGCAVGALPLDCPRPEDATAPCHCDNPKNPGWCQP